MGLFRPISLWPFPEPQLRELAKQMRGILVVEMSAGQMLEDVRLAVEGRCPVAFYGRMGGVMPLPDEILDALHQHARRTRLNHRGSAKPPGGTEGTENQKNRATPCSPCLRGSARGQ